MQLYTDNGGTEEEGEENEYRECISFYELFSPGQKLEARYRINKDCNIIYTIGKLTPKPCPNFRCKTWRGNGEKLNKRPWVIAILQ